MGARRQLRRLAAAAALAAALGAAAAEPAPHPVKAQVLRQARLDAEALAAIRARTRALVESLQQQPPPLERSLEGTVQAIEGDTLYLRAGPAVVPLRLQPSTRLIGRGRQLSERRLLTPAQQLRLQLHEGEPVRARFTVSSPAEGAQNLATSVQASPGPAPAPPPAQR
jgi:hypothetical protein